MFLLDRNGEHGNVSVQYHFVCQSRVEQAGKGVLSFVGDYDNIRRIVFNQASELLGSTVCVYAHRVELEIWEVLFAERHDVEQ